MPATVARLKRAVRRWRHVLAPGTLLLLYHRVQDLPDDPQLLSVSPEHFAQHLEVLRRLAQTLSLRETALDLRDGRLHRRGVVVTFDDGYADNLHQAAPVLQRFEVPATVFVVSGAVSSPREFWWDDLERIVLLPPRLPRSLRLNIAGLERHWELDESACDHPATGPWDVLRPQQACPRRRLYLELCKLMRSLPAEHQRPLLDDLCAWAELAPEGRGSHRVLTAQELRRLADIPGIDIGAHTVDHSELSRLDEPAQRRQIHVSRSQLEALLGRPIRSFSYPFGSRAAYPSASVEAVRAEGFDCSCSNFPGVLRRDTDLFQLPRMLVRDWDGRELARRLKEWFRD